MVVDQVHKRNSLSVWRRIAITAALLFLWFAGLLAVRARLAGYLAGEFLIFNLFLAGVPLVAALLYERAVVRKQAMVLRVGLFLLWLAFLPNAPYVGTDLLHLASRPPVPMWFDVVILGSAGSCGVWLGYLSVAVVHRAASRSLGRWQGWAIACVGLGLSGVGIYFGRFLRWYSWDLVMNPILIAEQLLSWVNDPASAKEALAVAVVYGGGLVVGYVALRLLTYSIIHAELRDDRAAA